jgi:hypothetical protein
MKEYQRRSRLSHEQEAQKQKSDSDETNDFIEQLQQLKKQRDENPYRKQEVFESSLSFFSVLTLFLLSGYSSLDFFDILVSLLFPYLSICCDF